MVANITQTRIRSIPRDDSLRRRVYEKRKSINPKTGRNYTFTQIGDIEGFSKQRAAYLFHSYEKEILSIGPCKKGGESSK